MKSAGGDEKGTQLLKGRGVGAGGMSQVSLSGDEEAGVDNFLPAYLGQKSASSLLVVSTFFAVV